MQTGSGNSIAVVEGKCTRKRSLKTCSELQGLRSIEFAVTYQRFLVANPKIRFKSRNMVPTDQARLDVHCVPDDSIA